jgi:quercetin dioxygenase-like cupin family protein
MGQARATRQLETERVRVTEWRFAAGEATGMHTHAVEKKKIK